MDKPTKKYFIPRELAANFGKELSGFLRVAEINHISPTVMKETLERTLAITDRLTLFDTHEMPTGASFRSLRISVFSSLVTGETIEIYAGSCPDYSHDNGVYTHESLGSGLPLLSKIHIDLDVPLVKFLLESGLNCRYVLMVADVEAEDEIFCQKFSNGSRQEFLQKCQQSAEKSGDYLNEVSKHDDRFISSSFFSEFGRERFLRLQQLYESFLNERYQNVKKFGFRIDKDTQSRMEMYFHMYPQVFPLTKKGVGFLAGRTIRTMAQYRVLADLISDKPLPIIINHPTVNVGVYNEHGLSLEPQKAKTIPVLVMKKKIY